ncbi:hypothetical protein M441DRAFT_46936 [Trichoderma asperellum CBS 433.97]|uniref:Apple domain-containing protein n=1 Tax=Trichoderma asperellum (strain ATCC 204424 / CBS 433.97 / NBRC 101777) TaxID=1042311 RepID=A0A2T3ZAJ6_TRIA4|nr:hypothetical protein M441DRAFT_46936 [Trichoderma asperellum CBS 433.97]PTB41827.1 hypothetical protein M441DRAFT_46936 [Trichoderma asperellum CBS 433.97]
MHHMLAGASALFLLASEVTGLTVPAREITARDQTFRANNGEQFAVESGFDYHGGDYRMVTANTFHDCINICSTQAACHAVSYRDKFCWLKSTVNAATANSEVSGAVRLQYVPAPIACPADGSNRIKETDNKQFTIQCGTDHPHGDIKSIPTLDFPNCIDLCDQTAGCIAASWRFGTCYLKKTLEPAVSSSWVDTAVLSSQLTSPTFCPGPDGQQIREASGRSFTVTCNTDRVGGDLANKPLADIGSCISWCDETNGCVAAVYRDGRCWLKNKLTAASICTNSQIAVLSSLSSPPALCPFQNGKQIKESSGKSFTIACNTDRPGNDLATKFLDNFNDCITWCDQTSGCVAAVYRNGQCWLKKTLSTSSTRMDCQVAVLSSKLPQTSTAKTSIHSTTTSTQKTTSTTKIVTSSSIKVTTSSRTGVTTSSTTGVATTTSTSTSTQSTDKSSSGSATTGASTNTAASTATGSTEATSSSKYATSTSTDSPATSAQSLAQNTITTNVSAPPGTLQTPTGPITLEAQPTATLKPLAPPNLGLAGTDPITPQAVAQLWFGSLSPASNSSNATTFPTVRVNVTFTYPSVIIDNSVDIINIQCNSQSLTAKFNTTAAYNTAKTSWAAAKGSANSLIIITAAPGCSSDGHYVYFVAKSIAFDNASNSVTCSGDIESVADIATEVGVDMGSLSSSSPSTGSELEATYGCMSPSSADIDGLPAIYCGPDFDERLDDYLGYYSGDESDLNAGYTSSSGTRSNTTEPLYDRQSERAATQAVTTVVKVVAPVLQHVESAAEELAQEAEQTIGEIASDQLAFVEAMAKNDEALAVFLATGNYVNSFNIPFNMGPPPVMLDTSPWGEGFKFYEWTPDKGGEFWDAQEAAIDKIKGVILGDADPEPSIELWCVNCGVNGNFKVTGSFHYTIASGLTEGQIVMQGNLNAGLFLGLNAFAEWDPTKEYDFVTEGLPGFAIPDIISVGPSLALGISVDLDIQAVGQYLVGASLTWPALSATLDFVHHANSQQSGWVPRVGDRVQADGSLTVSSTLGLPITLGFGINVLNGKYSKEIKLVDTPGIQAKLEYDFTNELTNGSFNSTPQDGCYGIAWDIGLVNSVVLDLSDLDEGTYTLEQWDGPVFASGCIGELAPSATSTASTGVATATSTSTPPPHYPDCATYTCPDYDSRYCMSNGKVFELNCLDIVSGTAVATSCVSTSAECFESCAENDCTAVNFNTNNLENCLSGVPGYYPCWNFGGATSWVPGGAATGDWGFVEVPMPAFPDCSTLACPDNHDAYCNSFGQVFQLNCDSIVSGDAITKSCATTSAECFETCARSDCSAINFNLNNLENCLNGVPGFYPCFNFASGSTWVPGGAATGNLGYVQANPPTKRAVVHNRSAPTATPSPSSSTDDFSNITITDATGQLLVNPHVNGSLFISASSSTEPLTNLTNGISFVADVSQSAVMGDSLDRLLYYFPDTVAAVNASRLRLGSWGNIPQGAELVTLLPTATSSGPVVLVALDSSGLVLYPFVCTIEGQLNKVFLVNDASSGSSVLMNPDLTYTIIGGVAQNCASLSMVASDLPAFGSTASTKT